MFDNILKRFKSFKHKDCRQRRRQYSFWFVWMPHSRFPKKKSVSPDDCRVVDLVRHKNGSGLIVAAIAWRGESGPDTPDGGVRKAYNAQIWNPLNMSCPFAVWKWILFLRSGSAKLCKVFLCAVTLLHKESEQLDSPATLQEPKVEAFYRPNRTKVDRN